MLLNMQQKKSQMFPCIWATFENGIYFKEKVYNKKLSTQYLGLTHYTSHMKLRILCDTLIWKYPLDVIQYLRSSYFSNNVYFSQLFIHPNHFFK